MAQEQKLAVSSITQMEDTLSCGREGQQVTLRLFEHNEKAYRVETRMMEQYGKAAIAHPTGTGKSYIVFKLIEEHSDSVIFWLSPSVYIFKTQIENLKRQDPDFPLENVCFCAYAKLMCCTKTQLAETPSYIILDKFHRTGVECWDESTVGLLKLCKNAKLLDLTATNVRYLDNNRDMAELFDGHIASEMTLGEAIVLACSEVCDDGLPVSKRPRKIPDSGGQPAHFGHSGCEPEISGRTPPGTGTERRSG